MSVTIYKVGAGRARTLVAGRLPAGDDRWVSWLKRRRPDEEPYEQRVARVLREHVAPEEVRPTLALLRPALQLVPAGGGEPVVARLGGNARLPVGTGWPVWQGDGPLSYVGEIFCGAVPSSLPSPRLPSSGRLLFFHDDGEGGDVTAGPTIWVPHGVECDEVQAPEDAYTFGERLFAGTPVVTSEGDGRAALDPELADAIDELVPGPRHRIGGYPYAVQGPVEVEIAEIAMRTRADAAASVEDEAKRWELLLQVDSDDDLDMMWGDVGVLYWLARAGTEVVAEDVLFTWQCC